MNDNEIHQFREATQVAHRKMAGVMSPSFRCTKCKQYRPAAGRKQAVRGAPKFGYVCAGCAQ